MARHVIVLAAGQGTRMKSDLPKVLHPVAGRPMVHWVLDAAAGVTPASVTVVVGHRAEDVVASLPDGVHHAHQSERLGTGHAALIGLREVEWDPGDTVLVVYGDTPMLSGATLHALASRREASDAAGVVLAATAPDPGHYGRVIRDDDGGLARIVEWKDASEDELAVDEVNSGMYAFEAAFLAEALPALGTANAQGEYYLPDVCNAAADRVVVESMPYEEMAGVNTHIELAAADAARRGMILRDHMLAGVRVDDPANTYVDATVHLAPGVHLRPGTHLRGATSVGAGSEVGPDTTIVDSTVGEHCHVWYAVVRGADIGAGVEVGPYASLRPGTVMREGSKAGTFVETKNSVLGVGSKVPHLSYLGDATLGERVNIGAGTITCNYDGVDKHRTEIGDDVFIGSDTMLIAPVSIGSRAVTGAGSAIAKDVGEGALAVERSDQREIPGYGDRLAKKKAAKRTAKEEAG
jgi:bifunctional UDP-N-acetylglucosamine pyrophosphorylase/glucosamine-1-phosphate N-acetyltransferase